MKLSEKIKDKALLDRVNLIGKYFKYFSQFNIDAVEVKIPIERVSAIQLVNEFWKEFYRLAVLSDKLNIDIVEYLRYFIIIKHFNKF